jgi:hypothetical protein
MLIVFFIFTLGVRCLVNVVFMTGYEKVVICITYMGLLFLFRLLVPLRRFIGAHICLVFLSLHYVHGTNA